MSAFDRQDAIRRMCELQARVVLEVVGYDRPADCFCGESGFHPLADADDYRNDFEAIEWIERVVSDAIQQQGTLDIVHRIATRGVGPDTSAEEALATIAHYVKAKLDTLRNRG